jgi:hypothetical protein
MDVSRQEKRTGIPASGHQKHADPAISVNADFRSLPGTLFFFFLSILRAGYSRILVFRGFPAPISTSPDSWLSSARQTYTLI